MEPVAKRLHLDEDDEDDHLHVRSLREKKSNEDDKTPLQLCLSYLHKILQRSLLVHNHHHYQFHHNYEYNYNYHYHYHCN